MGAEAADAAKLPPSATQKIDFIRDIHPILQNHCLKCHSDEKPRSHFRLTSRESALQGGEHGKDIIPGQSASSPLIQYVAGQDPDMLMPPEGRGAPLTANEISLLRAWIDQGVPWEPTLQEPITILQVTPTFGGTAVRGDAAKFRELYWQREGWNGGLESFEMSEQPSPDVKISASGRVLLDDYKLKLTLEKSELGFARFGWAQYRKYYDDVGGYDPLFSPSAFRLGSDLYTDYGRAWTEFGLTVPRWPRLVVGYEYQYRDGTEATLAWGPVISGTEIRNIYPSFERISEKVHRLKFDADYDLGGLLISDNFRGDWYTLDTQQFNESSYSSGASSFALTTATDHQQYFQGANTFRLEKQLTGWWLASGGYLYSRLNGDGAADVATLNPALLDPSFVAPGWHSDSIQLDRESHVFSVSSLVNPGKTIAISLGTQNEWTRQTGLSTAQVDFALPFAPYIFPLDQLESLNSDLDRSIFTQDLGVRFTAIPVTTLFAEARFQQDTLGQFEEEVNGLTPFLLRSDIKGDLQDFRAGFNTSPLRPVSFSGEFHRYDNRTDYDNNLKEPLGLQGYPGLIQRRQLLSEEAQTKLSLRLASWLQTSLSYQWQQNHYRTWIDPVADPVSGSPIGISPGGGLLAGTYNSQLTSLNVTLTPWRRLFISSTLRYQHAHTRTDASGNAAVLPYVGDIYTALLNGTFAINDKTELAAGYAFSWADFGQDGSFADGLPLGTRYHQHALQAGLKRQIAKGKTLGVQYRYYRYADAGTGGITDFEAHAVFATLAWRLP